jgi:hypothetical protein
MHRIKYLSFQAGWWLILVILATLKTEVRRIMVLKPALANSLRDHILKMPNTKQG